jgi:DNA-directed RNA polymerase subunit L
MNRLEVVEEDDEGTTWRLPKEDHTLGNLIAT